MPKEIQQGSGMLLEYHNLPSIPAAWPAVFLLPQPLAKLKLQLGSCPTWGGALEAVQLFGGSGSQHGAAADSGNSHREARQPRAVVGRVCGRCGWRGSVAKGASCGRGWGARGREAALQFERLPAKEQFQHVKGMWPRPRQG